MYRRYWADVRKIINQLLWQLFFQKAGLFYNHAKLFMLLKTVYLFGPVVKVFCNLKPDFATIRRLASDPTRRRFHEPSSTMFCSTLESFEDLATEDSDSLPFSSVSRRRKATRSESNYGVNFSSSFFWKSSPFYKHC